MKRLLLVAALTLTSCGSLLGGGATLTRSGNTITFDPGKQNAEDVGVYLNADLLDPATNPTFTVPCKPQDDGFGCVLGTVPGGQPLTFTVTGVAVNSGNATFYRPGAIRPFLVTLKGE